LVRLCVRLRGGLVVVSCSEAGIVVVDGSGFCACSHLVGGAAIWQASTGRLNERSVRVCVGGVATFGALGAVFCLWHWDDGWCWHVWFGWLRCGGGVSMRRGRRSLTLRMFAWQSWCDRVRHGWRGRWWCVGRFLLCGSPLALAVVRPVWPGGGLWVSGRVVLYARAAVVWHVVLATVGWSAWV